MLRAYLDGELFAERVGEGVPRLVGLHGWARSGADLLGVLEGQDALAPDLPGFGSTPAPAVPWGAHDYAHVVARLIEAEVPSGAVVVGHSFGGRVAVCLAAERPELVRALVLTGVPLLRRPGTPPPAPGGSGLVRPLPRSGLLGDAAMGGARSRHGSADYRAATGVMRDTLVRLVNESYEDELGRLTCPVELVWGSADTAAPLWIASEAADLVTDAHLTVIDGANHDDPLRHPHELRDAVARRLSPTP